MGRCTQGAAPEGEGAHPPPRRAERRTAPAADGPDRDSVRLRGAGRRGDPPPPLRRRPPAHRLSLHVRPELGAGLPELLGRRRRALGGPLPPPPRPLDVARPRVPPPAPQNRA